MPARTRTSRIAGTLALAITLATASLTGAVQRPAHASTSPGASVTTTGGVRVLRGLDYPTRHGPEGVDVYLPPVSNTRGPHPGIVFVHGGGWNSGNRQIFTAEATAAARHGYVGLSIDYDLDAPRDPREVHDVVDAATYARDNAARFDLDPDRLAGWGGSAGAHLIMQAAITDDADLQAVAGWSGPYDLTRAIGAPDPRVAEAVNNYLGCDDISSDPCREKTDAASPALHTAPGDPPVFLVNSTDELVPASQMSELAGNLRAQGNTAKTLLLDGDRHAVAYADDATGPTLRFLDAQLRPGGHDSYPGTPAGRAQDFTGAYGAVTTTEALVRLCLSTSKVRTYAPPRPKTVHGRPTVLGG